MRLDLGGIAKGYAVDQTLTLLHKRGIRRALVNASGDMGATEPPPESRGWRVAVAPLEPKQTPTRFGLLANRAIATSGDAFQYVTVDGVRYSHIVDPRTGVGLTRRSGVSILARHCTLADAMASAVSVMGPEEGLELVRRTPGVEALIVVQEGNRVRIRQTPGFQAWLLPAQPADLRQGPPKPPDKISPSLLRER
jgi:thiamine biosynthesis lipoprotein